MSWPQACILLVEDDEHDAFFVQYSFKKAGITSPLQIVSDGEQAIDYLAGAGRYADRGLNPLPELVLLDLKLPRKSGLEVLQWMRQQVPFRSTAVIALTSSCDPVDLAKCYALGVNSFVVKPVDLDQRVELARSLKAWWLTWNRFLPQPAACSPAPRVPNVSTLNTPPCDVRADSSL